MNTQAPSRTDAPDVVQHEQPATSPMFDRRLIAGVALILFGLLALVATFVNSSAIGFAVLPLLGILFIVWATLARVPGLMIPGGILTGLGFGVLFSDVASGSFVEETRGGLIVLGLGLGFLLILPLTWMISPIKHWWALIPAAILILVGSALLIGGPALMALATIGQFWPLIPIAVGVLLIWRMLRKR